MDTSGSLYCPVCHHSVPRFEPIGWEYMATLNDAGFLHALFQYETFNPISYYCPYCKSSDRDRLYALFLEQYFTTLDSTTMYRFIDFAPARQLGIFIKSHPFIEYRSADLFAADVDDRVDIMNMPTYASASVDFFLCSHVLEHVPDDGKALAELYRILKPGKCGILMTPIMLTLESTYENPEVTSPMERWKHFGQNDHLRIYAKQDFIRKVQSAGFMVHHLDVSIFGSDIYLRNGIHERAVLYIVRK